MVLIGSVAALAKTIEKENSYTDGQMSTDLKKPSSADKLQHLVVTEAKEQQEKEETSDNNNSLVLPDGWESTKDATTGKTYYFHRVDGKTSWVKPEK